MTLFGNLAGKKLVIGLVHLKPLPGTPFYRPGDMQASLEKAIADASALYRGGADGALVQTIDRVYPAEDEADPARVAAIAVITHEVIRATSPDFKVGVQLMWNGIKPSLGVARATGACFVRCTALMGMTTSAYGLINANPYDVQMYRKYLDAWDVGMLAEIEGYHFRWLGGEIPPIAARARMAMNLGADAVEVMAADEETNNRLVHDIKAADSSIPVILGGGTDLENVARRLAEADGALVGSFFESLGWGGAIDESRVQEYVRVVRSLEK